MTLPEYQGSLPYWLLAWGSGGAPTRGERAELAAQRAPLDIPSSQFSWRVLCLKLYFSQFFESSFLLFPPGGPCFSFCCTIHSVWFPVQLILVLLCAFVSGLFHLPLPCSGELLPMLQNSLRSPFPAHFPLPGRVFNASSSFPWHPLQTIQHLTHAVWKNVFSFISVTVALHSVWYRVDSKWSSTWMPEQACSKT